MHITHKRTARRLTPRQRSSLLRDFSVEFSLLTSSQVPETETIPALHVIPAPDDSTLCGVASFIASETSWKAVLAQAVDTSKL